MKRGSLLLVALFACTPSPGAAIDPEVWDGPAARWVSDLGRFEQRSTYNETSSVSNGGRWVVFDSHVKERPSRLFLVDTKHGRVRQIDISFDGSPRRSEGVGRYNIAFSGADADVTPDGRFVVFNSPFSNLVLHDENRAVDVFVYDRLTRRTEIVSRSRSGAQADADSGHPAISADGRFVAFDSRAKNLSPQDTDGKKDVYLKDLRTGRIELISVGPAGKGNDWSHSPDVSDDAERVVFVSDASNLVDDDTNETFDVFVRDRSSSATTRVSVTSEGEEFEAFESCASASCYVSGAGEPSISGNGKVVVFASNANRLVPEDNNYNTDVFAHDIDSGVTERVSVASDGGDAYRDRESVECGKNPICSQFSGTHSPSLSRDGKLVYFLSAAPHISDVDDDDDAGQSGEEVYIRNRDEGATYLASRYPDGSALHSTNWYPGEISADGRWMTYSNNSMKLDGPRGDRDPGPDVFLQRLPERLN